MKHHIVILGASTSELIGCIILSESFKDLSRRLIIVERTRPAELRALDEIAPRRVRIEPPLNMVHHCEVPFIAKPSKKVWPQDHLTRKKQHRIGHVKQGSRKYLKRPF